MARTRSQRPRRATVDAHVNYRGFNPSPDEWRSLEEAFGVSLNVEPRAWFKAAADRYVEETLLLHDGGARADAIGRADAKGERESTLLTRLIRKMRNLAVAHGKAEDKPVPCRKLLDIAAAWHHAMADPACAVMLSDFSVEIKVRTRNRLDMSSLMAPVGGIAATAVRLPRKTLAPLRPFIALIVEIAYPALREYRGRHRQSVIPRSVDPYDDFIGGLADAMELAGGKVSARSIYEGKQQTSLSDSRFVVGAKAVEELLDVPKCFNSGAARTERIKKAVGSRRRATTTSGSLENPRFPA
jgi:hypothetical protein